MFSKTDLEQKTNRELMQMCQDRGIMFYTGKTKSNKAVLVGRLMDYYGVSEARKEEPEKKPRKRAFNTAISYMEKAALKKAIRDCSEAESNAPAWKLENRDEEINAVEIGTLVAFVDEKGKARSAKIIARHKKKRLLKLVTEFEWEFLVSYDSVLWVRKGSRWPKPVYMMLKGGCYAGH